MPVDLIWRCMRKETVVGVVGILYNGLVVLLMMIIIIQPNVPILGTGLVKGRSS